MKRWTRRITVCLIVLTGGAITTVAVAWGFSFRRVGEWPRVATALWQRDFGGRWNSVPLDLTAKRYRILGMDRISADIAYAEGVDDLSAVLPIWTDLPARLAELRRRDHQAVQQAQGWPLVALRWHAEFDSLDQNVEFEDGYALLADANQFDDERDLAALPLRPIWPGFVIDTLFYAAIWGGVFFGFASAKRAIRRKRGRCPRCGYDLRGAPGLAAGCSECGWNRITE